MWHQLNVVDHDYWMTDPLAFQECLNCSSCSRRLAEGTRKVGVEPHGCHHHHVAPTTSTSLAPRHWCWSHGNLIHCDLCYPRGSSALHHGRCRCSTSHHNAYKDILPWRNCVATNYPTNHRNGCLSLLLYCRKNEKNFTLLWVFWSQGQDLQAPGTALLAVKVCKSVLQSRLSPRWEAARECSPLLAPEFSSVRKDIALGQCCTMTTKLGGDDDSICKCYPSSQFKWLVGAA